MSDSALVALIVFLVSHLGITIWWAATVSQNIKEFNKNFYELFHEIKEIKMDMFTRQDASREIDIVKESHKSIHHRIDRIEAKIET